jgi:protein involved in polysaccharide export with SLBB domain
MVSSDGTVNLNLVVSPLGDVLIPVVGIIAVDKLTLTEAFSKIRKTCLSRYNNALVFITLSDIRQFKVMAKGMVDKPGFIIVNPFMRVSEIIDLIIEEDVTETEVVNISHSLRNIKLIRNDTITRVDLVKFNITGDKELNPRLQSNDVICFDLVDREIGVYGGIKKPGKFEYVEGEVLADIIDLSGGFTDNADSSKIEITRFINDTEKEYIQLDDYNSSRLVTIKPEDHIIIRLKHDYKRQELVKVSGEVKYPGQYSIVAGKATIGSIIQKAGGFADRADRTKIIVNNVQISQLSDIELTRILLVPFEDRSDAEKSYLKARSRTSKGRISSSSTEYTGRIMNYPVQISDHIIIPQLHEYVELLGAVKFPGRYPLVQGKTADKYISDAGGLTLRASKEMYIVKSSTGQRLPFDELSIIDNGDVIFVAEKLEYNRWTRFREIMMVGGQMAAIIMVIQTAILN